MCKDETKQNVSLFKTKQKTKSINVLGYSQRYHIDKNKTINKYSKEYLQYHNINSIALHTVVYPISSNNKYFISISNN